MTMPTRFKICCIATVDEARLAISSGASAIGLVSRMPSGPGPIEEAMIAEIVPHVPRGVATFLLTCEQDAGAIADQQRRTGASTLQLVDRLEPHAYSELRRAIPRVPLVQVVHVLDDRAVDEAIDAARYADALLLDSGNPRLQIKELGGTGRIHDWQISRRIRDSVKVPVWLAGGLKAQNVGEAIRIVDPYGVDVCSGVRTEGRLDPVKLNEFVHAVGGG